MQETEKKKSMMEEEKKYGFGSMDKDKLKEAASNGGKRAHALRKAHVWSVEEAKKAGRKGGLKTSQNRQHMSEISKKALEKRRKATQEAEQSTEVVTVPQTSEAV